MAAPLRRALRALGPARFGLSVPVPERFYRADPLRRRPGPAPADPGDLRAAARRFGRLGEAAGVAAERLWPSPERLRELRDEEREWDPPLRDVQAALERREREEERRREERSQQISRSLASMPSRILTWRREREAARSRARADAERRRRLLAEAGLGSVPGTPGTPGRDSARAQQLLEELERQRRREEKRRRRQERDEAARSALAAAEAAAAAARGNPEIPPKNPEIPQKNHEIPPKITSETPK